MDVKQFSFLWLQIISQSEMWSTKICCFPLFSVGQAACCPLCGFLLLCVCGIVLGGIVFEVLFVLPWPPKWKSFFDAPFLITSPLSITNRHTHTQTRTHTPGFGMICRFRCFATLLPILDIQTQTVFPSSVFNPWEMWVNWAGVGVGGVEECRNMGNISFAISE